MYQTFNRTLLTEISPYTLKVSISPLISRTKIVKPSHAWIIFVILVSSVPLFLRDLKLQSVSELSTTVTSDAQTVAFVIRTSPEAPPFLLIHRLLLLFLLINSSFCLFELDLFFFLSLPTVPSFELLLSLWTSQILHLPFPSTESVIFVLIALPHVDETFHARLSAETIPIHCWSKCFRDIQTIFIIEKCLLFDIHLIKVCTCLFTFTPG